MLLFGILFVPFVHGFFRLIQESAICLNSPFSSSIAEHYHNIFLVGVNMIDFKQFRGESGSHDYHILLLFHICYIFILQVLLLNFLIALLSTSVAEVMEHKEVIMLLQKMNIIYLMELVQSKLSCFSFLWKCLQRQNFHVENGRFYLKVVSLNKRNL